MDIELAGKIYCDLRMQQSSRAERSWFPDGREKGHMEMLEEIISLIDKEIKANGGEYCPDCGPGKCIPPGTDKANTAAPCRTCHGVGFLKK